MRLLWMAENCYGNSLGRLVALSAAHPSVKTFLELRKPALNEVLESIAQNEPDIWGCYEAEGHDTAMVTCRQAKLLDAKNAWLQFGGEVGDSL